MVRGRLPAGRIGGHQAVVQIAVTGATAARFGLRPGSRLNVSGVAVLVTGIIEPADPGSAFWTVDPVAAAPALNGPLIPKPRSRPQWVGAAFVSPAALPLLQASGLPPGSVQLTWDFPLSTAHLTIGQVAGLHRLS